MEEQEEIKQEYLDSIIFQNINMQYNVPRNLSINTNVLIKLLPTDDHFYIYHAGSHCNKIVRDEEGFLKIEMGTPVMDMFERMVEEGITVVHNIPKSSVSNFIRSIPIIFGSSIYHTYGNGGELDMDRDAAFTDRVPQFDMREYTIVDENGDNHSKGLRVNEVVSFDQMNAWFENLEYVYNPNYARQVEIYKELKVYEDTTTVNKAKVNELAGYALKMYDKENISINISEERKTVELVVRYPHLTVTNEHGDSKDITDLYVSIPFDLNISAFGGIYGSRESFTTEDICGWYRDCCDNRCCDGEHGDEDESEINGVSLYSHSHLPADSYGSFTSFCLGSTPISIMASMWSSPNKNFPLQAVLYIVREYINTESLDGGPHIRMENAGNYEGDSVIEQDSSWMAVNSVLATYENNYADIPLKVNADNILEVNENSFIENLNMLAINGFLHTHYYGKIDERGVVIYRNRSTNLPEDVIEWIDGGSGVITFHDMGIRSGVHLEQDNAVAIDKRKFAVWPNITQELVKRVNLILKNNKFKEYVNGNS